MLKITGKLVPEAKPRALILWFEAFFIYCRVVYTIFHNSVWKVKKHGAPCAESSYFPHAVMKNTISRTQPLHQTKYNIHSDQLQVSRTQKSIFAAAKLYTISIKQHSKQRAVDIRARYPDRSVRETVPTHLLEEALAYATEPSRTHGSSCSWCMSFSVRKKPSRTLSRAHGSSCSWCMSFSVRKKTVAYAVACAPRLSSQALNSIRKWRFEKKFNELF